MTTEPTKAAEQALDRLDALAEPANGLLAVPGNSATACAIQADLSLIRAALTQRPAAQEVERDPTKIEQAMRQAYGEFDSFLTGGCKGEPPRMSIAFASGLFKTIVREQGLFFAAPQQATPEPDTAVRVCAAKDAICGERPASWCDTCPKHSSCLSKSAGSDRQDGLTLTAEQQATPEPCKDDVALALAAAQQSYPNPGEPEAGWCLLERKHVEALCRAARKATPEPVGEPNQFPPMPEGWPARFRCDSCDGNGEIGELVSMGDFQPPERQTCPDCGGRGWTSEEPAFNAEHMREFAEAHARCTRPAPGVPEGFALVPVEPTPEMMEAMPSLPAIGAPGDMELKAKGWSLKAIQNRHRWLAALAAAQAKGGE